MSLTLTTNKHYRSRKQHEHSGRLAGFHRRREMQEDPNDWFLIRRMFRINAPFRRHVFSLMNGQILNDCILCAASFSSELSSNKYKFKKTCSRRRYNQHFGTHRFKRNSPTFEKGRYNTSLLLCEIRARSKIDKDEPGFSAAVVYIQSSVVQVWRRYDPREIFIPPLLRPAMQLSERSTHDCLIPTGLMTVLRFNKKCFVAILAVDLAFPNEWVEFVDLGGLGFTAMTQGALDASIEKISHQLLRSLNCKRMRTSTQKVVKFNSD